MNCIYIFNCNKTLCVVLKALYKFSEKYPLDSSHSWTEMQASKIKTKEKQPHLAFLCKICSMKITAFLQCLSMCNLSREPRNRRCLEAEQSNAASQSRPGQIGSVSRHSLWAGCLSPVYWPLGASVPATSLSLDQWRKSWEDREGLSPSKFWLGESSGDSPPNFKLRKDSAESCFVRSHKGYITYYDMLISSPL